MYSFPYYASTGSNEEPLETSLALSDISTSLATSSNTIVMLGAGVSTNAGVPDFRSRFRGLYRNGPPAQPRLGGAAAVGKRVGAKEDRSTAYSKSPTELKNIFSAGSFRDASSRPKSLKFFGEFKELLKGVIAKSGADLVEGRNRKGGITKIHRLLGELKALGKLERCYTQNIDGFEEKEGLKYVQFGEDEGDEEAGEDVEGDCVQLHGTMNKVKCSECDYVRDWLEDHSSKWNRGESIECEKCVERVEQRSRLGKRALRSRSYLRPSIVLYDEVLPNAEPIANLAENDASSIDFLLVCGTSLQIKGFQLLVKMFAQAVRGKGGICALVNRESVASCWDDVFDYHVQGDCDAFVERIRSDWEASNPETWKGISKKRRRLSSQPSSATIRIDRSALKKGYNDERSTNSSSSVSSLGLNSSSPLSSDNTRSTMRRVSFSPLILDSDDVSPSSDRRSTPSSSSPISILSKKRRINDESKENEVQRRKRKSDRREMKEARKIVKLALRRMEKSY